MNALELAGLIVVACGTGVLIGLRLAQGYDPDPRRKKPGAR